MIDLMPRSLRARITAGVALLVMVLVALAGLIIVVRIDHRDRTDVDRELSARTEKVREDADKLLSGGTGGNGVGGADGQGQDDYGGLLAGSQSLVRLIADGKVVAQRGEQPATPLPVPTGDGYSTVQVGGQSWRSLVEPVTATGSDRLQVLENLQPIEERLADNTRLVTLVTVLATLLAGIGVWLLSRIILQPLQRLRTGAQQIRPADTGQQLPTVHRPREVADLSAALNRMLDQLQAGMLATRRFTADAGHELRTPLTSLGMTLETLQRNPDLPAATRADALAAMAVEHHRITTLLEGLQTLARGDAQALPARTTVDMAELVDEAVRHARHRHRDTTYTLLIAPGASPLVEGWHTGLRLALDNLLDNAALHGDAHGQVLVEVSVDTAAVRVSVTDDGPGIPVDRREAMKERFTRGPRPRSEGSGLGLALVEQQAQLHGGTLRLGPAPVHGLQATVTLPTSLSVDPG